MFYLRVVSANHGPSPPSANADRDWDRATFDVFSQRAIQSLTYRQFCGSRYVWCLFRRVLLAEVFEQTTALDPRDVWIEILGNLHITFVLHFTISSSRHVTEIKIKEGIFHLAHGWVFEVVSFLVCVVCSSRIPSKLIHSGSGRSKRLTRPCRLLVDVSASDLFRA